MYHVANLKRFDGTIENKEIIFIICSSLQHLMLISIGIMLKCSCNVDPLTPHFHIVKLWFTKIYIIFHIYPIKHRSSVLVKTASLGRF